MTTVLIATTPDEVQNLLPWACLLADSRGSELTVLLTQRRKGDTRLVEVSTEAEADESELLTRARETLAAIQSHTAETIDSAATKLEVEQPGSAASEHQVDSAEAPIPPAAFLPVTFRSSEREPEVVQVVGEKWQSGLENIVSDFSPNLVIVPSPASLENVQASEQWQPRLVEALDCDVMFMRDDSVAVTGKLAIGVFLSDRADNEAALGYCGGLAERFDGAVTAVYLEPDIGDYAASVGRRQVSLLLRQKVSPRIRHLFTPDAVVASSAAEAFKAMDPGKFDILIYGARDARELRRLLKASPVENRNAEIPAVAVICRGASFGARQWNRIDRWIRSFVPQMSREERINLVTRIQTSSQWDFDFVCLISLATLIACLGLAENSGAVIVGAMLVAPLMTPIAGVGLGVAHANAYLTKVAFRTALRGFATAVLIGVIFGLLVQGTAWLGWLPPLQSDDLFPSQMEARTRPQFYDLLIALASGVAAAYAMGRPNLFSALPGVAIAAALVPPIATSGIAFAHAEFTRGFGALLLFVTNMVTIILGTSLVFRMVGVRSQKDGPNAARWPGYVLLSLVLLSVLVTIIIEFKQRTDAG